MAKYGVKEVCDVTFYDIATNEPILFLDTLKVSSLENTAESTSARGGKGNPKILTWDFNREATVAMQDALMSPKSISMLTGNAIATGNHVVTERQEKLKAVASATAGKTEVLLANAPSKVLGAYKTGDVNEGGVKISTVTISGSKLLFNDTEVAVDALVWVYYEYNSDATTDKITISADKFPGYVKVVGDTVIRNAATGADEPFQMVIPKAKIQPGFTLTFQADGDPTVFDMNLEVFRQDSNSDMVYFIKY